MLLDDLFFTLRPLIFLALKKKVEIDSSLAWLGLIEFCVKYLEARKIL